MSRRVRTLLAACVCVLALVPGAQAAETFAPIGPDFLMGGSARFLPAQGAVVMERSGILYRATSVTGPWTRIAWPTATGAGDVRVQPDGALLGVAGTAIRVSTDAATWTTVPGPDSARYSLTSAARLNGTYYARVVDAVLTQQRILTSSDAGATWTDNTASPLPTDDSCTLAVRAVGDRLLAQVSMGSPCLFTETPTDAVFAYDPGAGTWSAITGGTCTTTMVAAADGSLLCVETGMAGTQVVRLAPGASTWTVTATGLPVGRSIVGVFAGDGDALLAIDRTTGPSADPGALYRFDGSTWQAVTTLPADVSPSGVGVALGRTFLGAAGDDFSQSGLIYQRPVSGSWSTVSLVGSGSDASALTWLDASASPVVTLSAASRRYGAGIWSDPLAGRSDLGDTRWYAVSATDVYVTHGVISLQMLRTTDGGTSFTPVAIPEYVAGCYVRFGAFGNTVGMLGCEGDTQTRELHRFDPTSRTWQTLDVSALTAALPAGVTLESVLLSGSAFALTIAGEEYVTIPQVNELESTTDYAFFRRTGTGFAAATTPIDYGTAAVGQPTVVATLGGVMLLGTAAGMYRSTDGGAAFTASGLEGLRIIDLIVAQGAFWAAVEGGDLQRSVDGITWAPVADWPAPLEIADLMASPAGDIYAATADGVWMRSAPPAPTPTPNPIPAPETPTTPSAPTTPSTPSAPATPVTPPRPAKPRVTTPVLTSLSVTPARARVRAKVTIAATATNALRVQITVQGTGKVRSVRRIVRITLVRGGGSAALATSRMKPGAYVITAQAVDSDGKKSAARTARLTLRK